MKAKMSLTISGIVVGAALFVFFVPIVYVLATPSNCNFGCASIGHSSFYESATHPLIGVGAVYGETDCCHAGGFFVDW